MFAQSDPLPKPTVGTFQFNGIRLQHPVSPGRPKVGLVLSGGGARGIAQVGVLRVLEKYHVPIDVIVGNSLGSVIGGLYASGYSTTQLESIVTHTNWNDLLSFAEETKRTELFIGQKESQQDEFLEIRFDGLQPIIPSSISGGQRLSNYFSYLTLQALYHPNPSFDDLKIPFRAIATDLLSGKRVILDHGSLSEAMRASVAVPLLYAPLEKDLMRLVDGGLVSNIPVDVAKSLGCDIVIVVNSTSPMRNASQMTAPWEVADQIMSIMMQEPNKLQLQNADVVITPEAGDRLVSDFEGIDSLVSVGEKAADQNIEKILLLLQKKLNNRVNSDSATYSSFNTIKYSGNRVMASGLIDEKLFRLRNEKVNDLEVQKSLEHVLEMYRRKGYSLARIESIQCDPDLGLLNFTINEGIIREINYEGNTRTKDYIIRREFPLEVGDVFNMDEAYQGIVNIKSTGLFEYVLLDVSYVDNRPIIVLKVHERSSELLRLGLRADNEHALVTTVDIRDVNFRGAWEDLGLVMKYGSRDRSVKAEYTVNRIFNTYFTSNMKFYLNSHDILTYIDDPFLSPGHWDRIENGRYREEKFGGSLAFGSHFERFGDVSAELRVEGHNIIGLSGAGYTLERYRFVGLKVQTIVDTEDKFSFPTKGMYLSLSYESASKGLGSEVGFGKVAAKYESYWTFLSRHTLRPRVSFGFADETLPIAEQFSLGGFGSFFGLREDDSRGRQMFLINMEYRYWFPFKLVFETYLKFRYDLGTISALPQELKLINFRHGFGGELALDTPLGQASFGIGKSFYLQQDLPTSPVTVGPLLLYFSLGYHF